MPSQDEVAAAVAARLALPPEVGPQGPEGPTGPQGDAGPAGVEGPAGPAGDPGAAGEQGPQGIEGPIGPEGSAGPKGDDGEAGPAGPQGELGPQGPQGEQGPAGFEGLPGTPGGPRGFQGVQGAEGPAGPQGDVGPTGPEGPQGEKGDQGDQGETGPRGSRGPMGIQGSAGDDGRTILNGLGPPPASAGVDGDFWIDNQALTIYGPKTDAGWGAGTKLEGDRGQPGPMGPGGPRGAKGDPGAGGGGSGDLSDDTPLIDSDVGSAGVGVEASRDDHSHPGLYVEDRRPSNDPPEDLAPVGARWIDDDDNEEWVNFGDEITPNWRKPLYSVSVPPQTFFVQAGDPGAVGTGIYWVDTSLGPPYGIYTRNAADDGWDPAPLGVYAGGLLVASVVLDAASRSVTMRTLGDGSSVATMALANDVAAFAVHGLAGGWSWITLTDGFVDITTYEDDGVTPTTRKFTYANVPVVLESRQVLAGNALTGGGDLSADRTLAVVPAAFVDPPTATPEAIANALIAAGLMAPA